MQKLEWEHLSIDLLPHPDMFADVNFSVSQEESIRKDEDGAKRVFFGGERFIEGISGEAYVCNIVLHLHFQIQHSFPWRVRVDIGMLLYRKVLKTLSWFRVLRIISDNLTNNISKKIEKRLFQVFHFFWYFSDHNTKDRAK